ncbi:MAG: glycosyltransferase family 4 protein [Gemmataceae bacterium]|nr:glycosyltransferase family 4 protein [Gemmataceae bacterium]MCI0742850.1 glycosyltransferase family 4 protein [Gemmataceae bacterium]
MHVVGMVSSLDHVCARYRLAAFRPYLESAGHSLEIHSWPGRWWRHLWRNWSLWQALRRADLVVVQRRLVGRWRLRWVRAAARVLAYDFDDAIFLRHSYDPRGPYSDKRRRRFARMVQNADVVLAGNRFLQEQAEKLLPPWERGASEAAAPSTQVLLVPTCVDTMRYAPARHTRTENCTLVWIGSSSTLRALEKMRRVLDGLGEKRPGLNLRLICDRSIELAKLMVCFCPWSQATETNDLAAADIGISWLPDDAWSLGKCGLKVLQYMAAGLPVVVNPVGLQRELVTPGVTGFWAETPEEWLAAIERLSCDPALRSRMGAAGRRRVQAEFHVKQGAALWLELLESLSTRSAAQTAPV